MNLNDYQQQAITTLTTDYQYGDIDAQLMGVALGLADESGEVLAKFKKILRDKAGKMTSEDKTEIAKELGDVLWQLAATAHLLGTDLESIAKANAEKLASRKARGVLGGSGDNR